MGKNSIKVYDLKILLSSMLELLFSTPSREDFYLPILQKSLTNNSNIEKFHIFCNKHEITIDLITKSKKCPYITLVWDPEGAYGMEIIVKNRRNKEVSSSNSIPILGEICYEISKYLDEKYGES